MIFVLMGPPGAGKGTQCDLIVAKRKLAKLSTGDYLRKQIADGTALGNFAKDIMNRGELVPDDLLLKLIKSGLSDLGNTNIILDGYPRTLRQASDLMELVGKDLAAVVHIDVGEKTLVERLSGRETCGQCGASYHKASRPAKKAGICDKCGGTLVRRPDDVEEKIKVRLRIYREETEPVIDFFAKRGLYVKVDGNADFDIVSDRVMRAFDA